MSVGAPQRGRPMGADGEQTRARVITAAMRCVAEKGYARATIREIARAAGMTSGSLYHYFPTKSDLLNTVVDEVERVAAPRLRGAAAQADDVVDRLAAVLDESGRLTREHPHLAAFDRAMRVQSNEYPGRPKHPGSPALRDIVGEVVDDALLRGALPPGTDPRAAADAIHALARGLLERAATLEPGAYAATLASAKDLISGTLFARPASHPDSTARHRSAQDP